MKYDFLKNLWVSFLGQIGGYCSAGLVGNYIGFSSAIDKESLLQDPKNKWKGALSGVNKNGLRLNMSIKCSPIKKGTRKKNLIFVLSSQH